MKTLNENQKDILGTVVALSLFWLVMGYFTATQPDYCQTNKVPQEVKKQTQSPVLEKYGELITKNK
jgi:methionine salvage enolase-phosphatase E1